MTKDEIGCFFVTVVELSDLAPRRRPELPNVFVKVLKCSVGDPSEYFRRLKTVRGKHFIKVRTDLYTNQRFNSKKAANKARDQIADSLAKLGYTVNPLQKIEHSIYVLQLKELKPGQKRFYVGQTTKSVETRIQEHLSGIRDAKCVRTGSPKRVEAMEPKRKFSSLWDAEAEETALGNELISRGFAVCGPKDLQR